MRKFIGAAVALVILVAAYWGWALAGTAQLASAASRGDAAAVMERVDLTSLSRSLSGQISRVPDAVTGRIAREIAQRISGSIDLHGG